MNVAAHEVRVVACKVKVAAHKVRVVAYKVKVAAYKVDQYCPPLGERRTIKKKS